VIFDSGGLNIKPGSGMLLMKKDMGGAAHVLGLAKIIMSLGLDVNLRVYIPAVENAISGNAYRPSDIIHTRKGTTVEIGNTDAEGRVVLSDALTLASEEGAERILDFATLTGAARIALGEDLPPIYARDTGAARAIQDLSFEQEDPLWHMPLFEGYRRQIEPAIADISNTGTSKFAGSVTAALFLDHFVDEGIDWYHLDVYAWNLGDRPGRPAGGEAQGIRAIYSWLETLYAG
jgi:leucyl aminopeptidase